MREPDSVKVVERAEYSFLAAVHAVVVREADEVEAVALYFFRELCR